MTASKNRQRIAVPEHEFVEFKSCCGNNKATLPKDVWKTIASFSNSHGGILYLGIDDDGYPVGLNRQDIDKLQLNISEIINEKFNIKPHADIELPDSHNYIAVHIHELETYNKPIYPKTAGPRQIYVRQGASSVRASNDEVRSLFAGNVGGENQTTEGVPSELIDTDCLDDYINHTNLKDILPLSIKEKLTKVKALRGNKLTIFGLVAFGNEDDIESNLNNIYIDFKMFPGTDKVDDELSKVYNDRKEFHGTILQQFTQSFEYVKNRIPQEGIINKRTGLREDRCILPEEALREALANAIAHRDYLLQESCINIDLYSDRIEIINPGESLVPIRNLENTPSKARNPNIMEFLKTYKVTDKTARGIPTIYKAARSRGLLDPEFSNIAGCFRAVLYFSSPHSGKDRDWINNLEMTNIGLKDTQKNALVYIRNNGEITNKIYCEINHMNNRNDDRQARREITDLIERGIVEKTGNGSGTKYRLRSAQANPDTIRT